MKSLYNDYKNYKLQHVHCSDNEEQNIFEDALIIQAERIVKNIMESLKITKAKACKIAFCDSEVEQ